VQQLLLGWLLGLVLGVRHAFEPDHLVAIATYAEQARGFRAGIRIGAAWGLGHTLTLAAVAGLLSVVDRVMPASLALAFERVVGLLLVGLGATAIIRSLRRAPVSTLRLRGPVGVGLVHGLAGSGALTSLAMARVPTAPARVAFVLLFGVGSALGMAVTLAGAGVPIARLVSGTIRGALGVTAGTLSVLLGLVWLAIHR
jgi:hypothetical protein